MCQNSVYEAQVDLLMDHRFRLTQKEDVSPHSLFISFLSLFSNPVPFTFSEKLKPSKNPKCFPEAAMLKRVVIAVRVSRAGFLLGCCQQEHEEALGTGAGWIGLP